MRISPRPLGVCALVLCIGLSASLARAGDEWRAVDPAELAMKNSTVEKDADAEALFWEVRLDDSQAEEFSLKNYIRIKIFNDRGKESQSKVDLPYTSSTRIKDIAARVIKPDGTIVELKKEDIFDRTIVKTSGVKIKAKSFALPSIEAGSIIEYRWREVIPGGSANKLRIQFQREIPVANVTYYLKPYQGMGYFPYRLGETKFVKDKDGFFKFGATNMPALREEPNAPPENELRAWIFLFFTEATKLTADKYWTDYGKRLYEGTKDLVKADGEVKNQIATIVGDATEPQDKLRRIYDFCRIKIKNISDDASGLTADERQKLKENKSPSDTLKRGQGTGTDIDLLFTALAKAAGFDARLALSGNRDDLFFKRDLLAHSYFLGSSFVAVKVGDNWQFFSPAEKYTEYGMLGWPEENQDALILDPKEPFWVSTPLSGPEKSVAQRTGKFRLLEDGTLEGDVQIQYTGHLGYDKKEYNDDDSPSEREDTLKAIVKRNMSTADVSEIKIENVTDPLKPFTYSYHVRVPGYAQRTGKRLFFQPGVFARGAGSMFPATDRKYDVYFHYPWSERDHVTIELPPGFALDNAEQPQSITPDMTQQICAEKVKISSDGHVIVYDRDFFFGGRSSILFPVRGYAAVKQLFDAISRIDDHTLTLKQATSN